MPIVEVMQGQGLNAASDAVSVPSTIMLTRNDAAQARAALLYFQKIHEGGVFNEQAIAALPASTRVVVKTAFVNAKAIAKALEVQLASFEAPTPQQKESLIHGLARAAQSDNHLGMKTLQYLRTRLFSGGEYEHILAELSHKAAPFCAMCQKEFGSGNLGVCHKEKFYCTKCTTDMGLQITIRCGHRSCKKDNKLSSIFWRRLVYTCEKHMKWLDKKKDEPIAEKRKKHNISESLLQVFNVTNASINSQGLSGYTFAGSSIEPSWSDSSPVTIWEESDVYVAPVDDEDMD